MSFTSHGRQGRDKTLIMMTFQSHSHIIQGQECQREREGEMNEGRDCAYVYVQCV